MSKGGSVEVVSVEGMSRGGNCSGSLVVQN